ncbi:hypothetical protein [Acinetobacter sp. MD2(2019)]|uniref:hypothetical protein n=1 Tax=Acinetobacter sp. MD2(2019) TaxID=2605273 RepID=UPI002D1F2E29|nr:hypothetical protein [Acinetobacter sp. MD2(2019)]MEB3753194.1 hypothetical protein [Acinetobacter sp. MD2(2019)]
MKFFWFPLCLFSLSIWAKNFDTGLLSAHGLGQSSCKARHSKHYFRRIKAQPEKTDDNPFAPQFDPNSPELARQLMAVFGEDSLADRTQRTYQAHRVIHKFGFKKSTPTPKKKPSQKSGIKAVLSDLSKQLPFQSDLNLGSNSNTDVYVELNAQKEWQLSPDLNLNTQQTFRYGAQSKNYSETYFNFTQKQEHHAIASTDLSVTKTYEDTYNWENHLFRKQHISHDQSLTYGLYSNGIYNKEKREIELQNWGPYLAWRRPIWRTWLYLENGISYYEDRSDDNRRTLSTTLQFEMNF